jgi:tripartite-type tricarboxylate transporter receptor subunit TctC
MGQLPPSNDVRSDGSFPRKRSPGAGDGCAADHCQPGLLLVAELAPIADAAGGRGICKRPARDIPPFARTGYRCSFIQSCSSTKEGFVGISERRKSRVETPPIVSKSRRTQGRAVEAAMPHGHPFRVNTANLPRRRFLHLAAGAAALPAVTRIAWAQTYPTRPVRLIVGFPPGGAGDITARLMGQWLSERLGQQFIIENRPGAGSNIGTEAVVRAAPDGYTLLVASSANAINATLYDKLKFNFIRDITPVGGITRAPQVMVVNPSSSAKTVPEFITYAKAHPGKINMASAGTGTGTHVAGELFKMMTGVKMAHVPYRGGAPALTDLLGGQVQVMFATMASSIEYIRAGELRALAVTAATRSDALPDIPAVADFVPGYETSDWFGLVMPMKTPAEIISKINMAINAALGSPVIRARLADLGGVVFPTSPSEFYKFIADETEKWGKVIRAANIKAE